MDDKKKFYMFGMQECAIGEGTVKSVNAVLPNEEGDVALTSANIPYDNSYSGLAAINAQSAIDELSVKAGTPGAQGPAGPQGPKGDQGIQGIPGNSDSTTWVSGYMMNRAIATGVLNAITPVGVNGDTSLIKRNEFVADSNGIWQLYIGPYICDVTVASIGSIIYKNRMADTDNKGGHAGAVSGGLSGGSPWTSESNATLYLKKGEYLQSAISTTTAANSINLSGEVPFVFRRVA